MTTTITERQGTALPEDLARRLEEIASERGLTPVELVRRHFQPQTQTVPIPNPEAPRVGWTPQSLDELKPALQPPPGQTIRDMIPREPWPGEVTDQELLASLKEMDAAPKPSPEQLEAELRAWRTPQSLDELKPRSLPPPGMTAMEYIRGKWPGDETEEELLAMLKAMG